MSQNTFVTIDTPNGNLTINTAQITFARWNSAKLYIKLSSGDEFRFKDAAAQAIYAHFGATSAMLSKPAPPPKARKKISQSRKHDIKF